MEGVSVLHEEPFNEFGEKSWPKYILHKTSRSTTQIVFLDFLFETVRVLLMGGYQS